MDRTKIGLLGRRARQVLILVLGGALVILIAGVAAADSAALLKDADKSLREAEKAMFSGKMDVAREELDKAAGLVEQAKQEAPQNTKIRSLETRITRLRKNIEARTGKTDAPAKPEAAPAKPEAAPAGQPGPSGKLPSGVSYRLKGAEGTLAKGERAVTDESTVASKEWRIQTAQAAAESARGTMAEIEQKFSGQYSKDHPEIKAMNERIAALEEKAKSLASAVKQEQEGKAQAAAQATTASAGWVTRLKPYVTGMGQKGYDEQKYLVASATREEGEMAQRLRIYGQASAALAEYKAAGVATPTEELNGIVQELDRTVKDFATSCTSYSDEDFRTAEQKLNHAESFVAEQEAKAAAKEQFILMSKDMLLEIRKLLDRAAGLAKKDDPRLATLQTKLDDLMKRDAKLRAASVADTRMIADKYKGQDAEEIKQRAGEFLKKAQPEVQALRTTVISPDWKEESVTEYTDTTQTALRHRVTRSVSAQVAAKKGAETFLYTLFVGKDRRTDGSWGDLYGHVMFTDPILEENVSKDAP
jgi:hypothetical protein